MEGAVRRGDLTRVQMLIQSGVEVNDRRKDDCALLMVAIEEGYTDIALELIKAGADIHGKDNNWQTALHMACDKGLGKVVQALIDRGSRVDQRDKLGRTPFMIVSGASHYSPDQQGADTFPDCSRAAILMCLLRARASCEGLSTGQLNGLLRHACSKGDVRAVLTLLENGCSVSQLCREDQVRLFRHGSNAGTLFAVQALIKNGCSVSVLPRKMQEALLRLASHECQWTIVRDLLKNGCRISILTRKDQEQLLYHAHHASDVYVVHTLLKNGCSAKHLPTEGQEVILCHASHTGGWPVVWDLLKKGYRVSKLSRKVQEELLTYAMDLYNVPSPKKFSILGTTGREALFRHACYHGDVFIVHALLKNGCSVSFLESDDQRYLFYRASHTGDLFVVHALLKYGYSVNMLSCDGQEELLRHASHESDMIVVHALLKNGCSVNVLPQEEQEELLCHAFHEGDMFVFYALLKNGCSVNILQQEEQEELLCHASHEGDMLVVHALLKNGCSVNMLPPEDQEELLRHASHEGDMFVVHALLKNGCSLNILSSEDQEELLRHASHKGDVVIVHVLLENGCSVNILPCEDQEELLRYASAKHVGDMFVVHALLKNGCKINILSSEQQKLLFCHACQIGDAFVVEALISSGFNVNCVYDGYTPLMIGAREGHEAVLKKLILAGADVGMQSALSETALHLAALSNHIHSGILLVEGGASTRIKNTFSQTPLEVAAKEFKEAIKEAMSFTTRKTLCIIGNAEGGKSTLIAALQAESNSFIGKIFNRIRRVNDCLKRTAGIETLPYCSQRYGEVLFYDFAGQHEYHGPHQMFLEALLCKPGVSVTLLLVVKATIEEEAILYQLHRWLSPVALLATTASPPQVIIVGSFLDKVKSKMEATAKLTRCIEATKEDLKRLPLEFVGLCLLNCRRPQSAGINKLCNFLQDIPIPDFRATHTQYSLAWVLSQIRLSFTDRAVQLQEFSAWIQENKSNLPRTMPPAEEVCQDLSAAGHALYLVNKEHPTKSWLVLDLPSILHDVYGTLFSHSKGIVNEFGLLHFRHLDKLFPDLDLVIVQQLLISLEFCIPVDPVVLKVELSKLTQSEEASGWLFFPALISAKPSQSLIEAPLQQNAHHFCWQLKTSKKHSISARILQTILLHMAAHFVVKHHQAEGALQHCCSIWWNGISWQSKKGIDVAVHISNNRVIQVVGASITSADKSCQYLTEVISDILVTIHQLSPKLAATAYILHPPKMATMYEALPNPFPRELFPVADIQNSIKDCDEFSLSLKDNDNCSTRVPISDLFGGCIPSLADIERIFWTESESNSPQSPAERNQTQAPTGAIQTDILSQTVYTCEGYLILFRMYVSRKSAGKGRAMLEGVGLTPETIAACCNRHPLDEEEVVQDGLNSWAEGHHGYSPTWKVLLEAMAYAGIGQQHCEGLREELYQKLTKVPTKLRQSPTEPSQTRSFTGPNQAQLSIGLNYAQSPTESHQTPSATESNLPQPPTELSQPHTPSLPEPSQARLPTGLIQTQLHSDSVQTRSHPELGQTLSPTGHGPNQLQLSTGLNYAQSPTESHRTPSTTESSLTQPSTELSQPQSLVEMSWTQSFHKPNHTQLLTGHGPSQLQLSTELNNAQSPTESHQTPSTTESNLPQPPTELSQPHTPSLPEPSQAQLPTGLIQTLLHSELVQTQSHPELGQTQSPTGHGPTQLQLYTGLNYAQSPTEPHQTPSTTESNLTQPPTEVSQPQSLIEMSHTLSLPEPNQVQLPTGLTQTQLHSDSVQTQSHPELGQTRSPTGHGGPTQLQLSTGLNYAQSPTESHQTPSTTVSSLTWPSTEVSQPQSLVEMSWTQSFHKPNHTQLLTGHGPSQLQLSTELNNAQTPTEPHQTPSTTESNLTQPPTEVCQPQSLIEMSHTPSLPKPNHTQILTGPNQVQLSTGLNYARSPTDHESHGTPSTTESSLTQPSTELSQPQSLIEVSWTQSLPEPNQANLPTGLTQTQLNSESGHTQSPTEQNQTQLNIELYQTPAFQTQSLVDPSDHEQGNTLTDPQLLHSLHQEPPLTTTAVSSVYLTVPPMQSAQALLDISSTPHPRDISELFSKQVAANWRDLALGLGVDVYVCENISKDHPTDCEEACWEMLNCWLKGERDTGKRERTWRTLLTVAQQMGHGILVNSLRWQHFKSDISVL